MNARSGLKALGVIGALSAAGLGLAMQARATLAALIPPTVTTRSVPLREFEHLARFGSVEVATSDATPQGLVMLATTATDAKATREDALALARQGLIAVTLDLDLFKRALAATPSEEGCHYVTDDLKDIAQAVYRALGTRRYFFPVIAGRGEGAAFAYAALAQAPDNTVAGAISIGFEPVLHSDRPFCADKALAPAGADTFTLQPDTDLPNPWLAITEEGGGEKVEAFIKDIPQAEAVPADPTARRALVAGAVRLGRGIGRGVSGLPVSIIEPEGPVTGLAIVISGDGGWRDIDKSIGELLAKQGVAVVGLDSLRYFWSKKEPVQVAADLSLLLEHYGRQFDTDRYALVGYSFGADIMPDVWPLLPKEMRDRVRTVSLLGFGTTADFQISVAGFVGADSAEGRPLAPLIRQLPLERSQCIFGKEEAEDQETSCTAPDFDQGERIAMEGGHHFDGDYDKVAEAILRRLR